MQAIKFRKKYRNLWVVANQKCPVNSQSRRQSKSRNLYERLMNFENEMLLFMEDENVQFTNNFAENDQRMTKIQQKVSGVLEVLMGPEHFVGSGLISLRVVSGEWDLAKHFKFSSKKSSLSL